MSRSRTIACIATLVLSCLCPNVGADTVELSVFGSYRIGGEIDDVDRSGDEVDVDLDIDDSVGVGALIAFPLYRQLRLELLYSRQESELETDTGFLAPPDRIADLRVEYYHVGLSWDHQLGRSRPFVGGGLGATVFDASGDAPDDDSRFSLSFGGGVKYALSDTLALRLETRFYATWIDDDERLVCGRFHCYRYDDDESMEQLEVSLGLTFTL